MPSWCGAWLKAQGQLFLYFSIAAINFPYLTLPLLQ